MNFNVLDLSFFSVVLKIVLVVVIFVIIVQALKIMSKDVKRGLKSGKNLGWKLKLEYSEDGGSFVSGDVISLGNKISIGRNKSNQMVLPSQSVSNFHAQIFFEDGRYMLEDLNSTNGTFINGIKVDKKSLNPGDEIRISQTVFIVSDDD